MYVCLFAVDGGFTVDCSFVFFVAESGVVFFDQFCVMVYQVPWIAEQGQFGCFDFLAAS